MLKFELSKKDISSFKSPWGKVLSFKEAEKKLDADLIVAVGDRVSWNFSKSSKRPNVFIVDGREQRQKVKLRFKTKKVIRVKNIRGTVSNQLWNTVERSLKEKDVKIFVNGEEDLAVLPVIMLAPDGAQVLYGQPNKGVVLLRVDQKLKEKVASFMIDYYVRLGKEFFSKVKKEDRVFVVHHTDADGCTSAALVMKKLKDIGVKKIETVSPRRSPVLEPHMKKQIADLRPTILIIVDMGNENSRYLKRLSKKVPICIIDHHKLFTEDFGKALLVNPHKARAPLTLNPSAAHFVRQCTDGPEWLATVGSIGDKGLAKIGEMQKRVREKKGVTISELEECAILINSAEAFKSGSAEIALKALMECKQPKDLLYGYGKNTIELRRMKELVHGSVMDIVKNHKKDAKFYKDLNLIALEVGTGYSIKSNVADFLQDKYPKWIVMIYRKEHGHKVNISVRTHTDFDLAVALKKSLKGIGKGGGHAPAAGGLVGVKNFHKFFERFKSELSKNSQE